MKEIVERLKEKRQIELAKRILESNGYKIDKISKRLKESAESDPVFRVFTKYDHRTYDANPLYDGTGPFIADYEDGSVIIASLDGDSDDVAVCLTYNYDDLSTEYERSFSRDIEAAKRVAAALLKDCRETDKDIDVIARDHGLKKN